MIYYIEKGDIFSIAGVWSYAHGCNCAGAMGKGIALEFKKRYPEMYKQYVALCHSGQFSLGDVFDYCINNSHVYNLATQRNWWTHADIESIHKSLIKMLELARSEKVKSIAMPAIGSGLGGLEWASVKQILNTVASEYPEIALYVVEKYGESDKVFIKKYWDEADILFLLHFEGGYAVRQIEIHQDFVVCLSINKPIENEFFLYDQTLNDLVIDDKDIISQEEFDSFWNKYELGINRPK